jgi:repressor LexA
MTVARARLTARQRTVLEVIYRRVELSGRPPTLRELGDDLGIASTNGVRDHLKALEAKGFLRRDGHSARGIRLVAAPEAPEDAALPAAARHGAGEPTLAAARANLQSRLPAGPRSVRLVPVLGRVAAGVPILAEQNVEGHLALDARLVRHGDVFALRVQGDSMRDAGILDGDYVFVRQQPAAQPRDIVVALLDDETTVKRYVPAGEAIRLEPENPAHQPIVVGKGDARLAILGKVCAVLRTI